MNRVFIESNKVEVDAVGGNSVGPSSPSSAQAPNATKDITSTVVNKINNKLFFFIS